MSSAPDSDLVIGVGHGARQDDGVGPYVAEAMRRRGLPAVVHEGEGTGLLDLWDSRHCCVVIDAVAKGGAPGQLHVFADVDDPGIARTAFVHSTHRIGVPEAIALGRALGRLPGQLVVIGITGEVFGFGNVLSPTVAAAADDLIDRLADLEDLSSRDLIAALAPGAR